MTALSLQRQEPFFFFFLHLLQLSSLPFHSPAPFVLSVPFATPASTAPSPSTTLHTLPCVDKRWKSASAGRSSTTGPRPRSSTRPRFASTFAAQSISTSRQAPFFFSFLFFLVVALMYTVLTLACLALGRDLPGRRRCADILHPLHALLQVRLLDASMAQQNQHSTPRYWTCANAVESTSLLPFSLVVYELQKHVEYSNPDYKVALAALKNVVC